MNAIARFDGLSTIDGVAPTRLANSTLISGRSTVITREDMLGLRTPEATDSFRPVPHIELVRGLEMSLAENGIYIAGEKFSVNREGNALFGVMDLKGLPSLPDFSAALGIRTANDKTMSIQLGVGAKVFICDNLAFHADMIALKRKHTSGLDLIRELRDAVRRYIEKFGIFAARFDGMKNVSYTPLEAKQRIYDIFAKGLLSTRYFQTVDKAYFAPEGTEYDVQYANTAWALHNAFTWALKPAPMGVQQTATLQLAREFGIN